MKNPRPWLALLLFPLSLAFCVLLSHTAFGQVVVTPPAPLTAATLSTATIVIALLAIVVGYVTQAINSGSLFGVVTIPKPLLPYLGLAGGFLGPFTASITASPLKDESAWLNALFAGLLGLGGIVMGVTAKQHIDAALRDRTPVAGSGAGGGGVKVDAVTQAANDVAKPPTAQRVSVYRLNPQAPSSRLALPRWITRMALAVVVSVVSMGTTAAVVETTGCANGVPTPQTQAQIAASEALGVCIETEYVADASKAPPPAALQIALDIASTCGAEAVDVVGAFTTPLPAAPAASPAPSRSDVATVAQANAPALHIAVLSYHQKRGS
jgi:hypothetical protein